MSGLYSSTISTIPPDAKFYKFHRNRDRPNTAKGAIIIEFSRYSNSVSSKTTCVISSFMPSIETVLFVEVHLIQKIQF